MRRRLTTSLRATGITAACAWFVWLIAGVFGTIDPNTIVWLLVGIAIVAAYVSASLPVIHHDHTLKSIALIVPCTLMIAGLIMQTLFGDGPDANGFLALGALTAALFAFTGTRSGTDSQHR